MRLTKTAVCLGIMQAATLAAKTQKGGTSNIVGQITAGFSEIIAGSLGLKIAVIILVVIGLAIGYWQGSAGGF